MTVSDKGNYTTKNLNDFLNRVKNKGGYYIGRYEARNVLKRYDKNDELTELTVNGDDYIYNYVTQPQAAILSRNMYDNENFESDLVNSYVWDTALVFIQGCSEDEDYSRQGSFNIVSIAEQGTNKLENNNQDEVCNIWDMASNCLEWNTESTANSDLTQFCTARGENYFKIDYSSYRCNGKEDVSVEGDSFRVILYL